MHGLRCHVYKVIDKEHVRMEDPPGRPFQDILLNSNNPSVVIPLVPRNYYMSRKLQVHCV